MSQNVSLSKGEKVKVTLAPTSKLTAKGAEWEIVSGDCTLEDDEKDKTAKYIIASESVGQSIVKVFGKIHPKLESKEEGEEEGEEGGESEEEEEELEEAEELIYVDVTDPNSSSLGVNISTPEPIETEEEEEGGEEGAKKEKKKASKRKKSKK